MMISAVTSHMQILIYKPSVFAFSILLYYCYLSDTKEIKRKVIKGLRIKSRKSW